MFRRSLDTEEVHLGAESEDEVVVGQGLELAETDLARVEIDRRDRVLVNPRVRLLVNEIANRVADRRLLEQPRRHLVQERLEGVVVVLVDEDDVDIALLQLLHGADAREAAADDQDAGAPIAFEFCAHGILRKYGAVFGPGSPEQGDRAQVVASPAEIRSTKGSSDRDDAEAGGPREHPCDAVFHVH